MAAKSSAKKTASSKSAGARKAPARKAAAGAAGAEKRPPKRSGGSKDTPPPSFWMTGTLVLQDGVIGMRRNDDTFISLADAAAGGHMVTLVFQPAAGTKGTSVQQMLDALAAFIEAYGVENIPCGLTCCGAP